MDLRKNCLHSGIKRTTSDIARSRDQLRVGTDGHSGEGLNKHEAGRTRPSREFRTTQDHNFGAANNRTA